jgi:uncharacterized protein
MNPYYIYALKDPRGNPAKPFYIGKGTGSRAWDHTSRIDETRKGRRIAAIAQAGLKVLTVVLADDLTEAQALRLEAELIAAFGLEELGGLLTNSVAPSVETRGKVNNLIVPVGVVEKAQIGLELIKSAVLELAQANAPGITNAEASKALGLQSDYAGGSKDYLAWSVLGLLMREGKIRRHDPGRRHRATVG